ncbi:ACT domain-containing protein [Alteromonas ponticola]|uniref:ACT domain-containing protein n=1 Tax=Alteromonas aquimaris TaxID=2998417 RepID=A0ABT3P8V1_9ALTE|nr:ACT domain-containing protein [Alteromonas aquimaris]MCW8109208.1 ACT domain-containing protein [Alteromonas aquimaris]
MQKADLTREEGELDLNTLVANLNPSLDDKIYVFISVPLDEGKRVPDFPIKGLFHEREGCTCIVEKKVADAYGYAYSELFCCLTCEVHSSLNAVGLTAVIATTLAKQNISANVVAGFYHDHIFIPTSDAHRALSLLNQL